MRRLVGTIIVSMALILTAPGCDEDRYKLADGTIVSLKDLPPGFDTTEIEEASLEDVIESGIKGAKPALDLVPYGSTAGAAALILLGMWRKMKPGAKALEEVFDGIEAANGNSEEVLASLGTTMSPESKKLVNKIRLKRRIAAAKATGGDSELE